MHSKRSLSKSPNDKIKRTKDCNESSYFHKCLEESGLKVKFTPNKCIALHEPIYIIRNIKKNLERCIDYPRNLQEFFSNFEAECQNLEIFKHYLFPNVIRVNVEGSEDYSINDSLIKILLSVPVLQEKLINYIFEKAIDLAADSQCGPWIQVILKCLSSLDITVDSDKMCTNLINLLDITMEKIVKLEIITAIPDILEDQVHDSIATEISRMLSEDHELIPAILDCFSYLCLSDEKYEELQKKSLSILISLPKCNHFPNFVKFLLLSSHMNENTCFETIMGIRNALNWPTSIATDQEVASSQVLTFMAIRNSMVSSKIFANTWIKVISTCKVDTDSKPIDFVLLLILYTTSEDRQKQVETIIRRQIKLNVLKENSLNETFDRYKTILKEFLKNLIDLTNSLLKIKTDPMVKSFASYTYTLMLSKLGDCSQTIVAELLQLGLDCKNCVTNILFILNDVASNDMSLLKPQSLQMLTLLDRMDNMSISEIRAVMNLVCSLSYTYENSVIRDDIHMIIRKELGSSNPAIKIQGILAGVHAVKYLAATHANEDQTIQLPDESEGLTRHLTDNDLREAVQIIELICRSTRQFPDMTAFFYDELSKVISSGDYVNKHFLSWLTNAVTNDLQNNFIIDTIDTEINREVKLSLQYCLNSDSEVDEVIAINLAGLTLQPNNEVDVSILSSLFHLVQTLHSKEHNGDLSGIDALLGCAVVMPVFDIDLIDDMDLNIVSNHLDCLIHCVNWFRELINAFATQNDTGLKTKILKRVLHVKDLEDIIDQVFLRKNLIYKPPICAFDVSKYIGEKKDKTLYKVQNVKQKSQKKTNHDDSILPASAKSQITQNSNHIKSKLDRNIPLREFNLSLLNLLTFDFSQENETEDELSVKTLTFLLKCVNNNLHNILISKIKKKTAFVSKSECEVVYNAKQAEKCAKAVNNILPKMMIHLQTVISYIETHTSEATQNETGFIYTPEVIDYISCLDCIYNMFTIYFRWIGFKNHHNALLKISLRIVANVDNVGMISLKDLLLAICKYLQNHEKYCLQLSTAMALIDFMKAIEEHSCSSTPILKTIREVANDFLARSWKTRDGMLERGLMFNQAMDKLTSIYFINNEILELKSLTLQLNDDIRRLKSHNDTLTYFKTINKANFPILYRNLSTAVYESTRSRIDKGLTNPEHLELWKDVAIVLKHMSEIAKTLISRNNLSIFFKKSLPILKLFLSKGIPLIEKQFGKYTDEVLEILKILQQSTRFMQSLCCHSRLNKDTVLISKVPQMRQLLETLIYKVKAALAANNCTEAFWMGNLKNKDIHGEIIATQQSMDSEESIEDCDDQLPEDDSEGSDDELINPDSKSVSDIV